MTTQAIGAGILLLVVFAVLWSAATRRHLRRRRSQREWDGADARPDLWTSAARCPACGARRGLLEVDGDELWFVCLSCHARHRRTTKG